MSSPEEYSSASKPVGLLHVLITISSADQVGTLRESGPVLPKLLEECYKGSCDLQKASML